MSERDPLRTTAKIVTSFVGHNRIAVGAIPDLIRNVHQALARPSQPDFDPVQPSTRATVAQIKRSITPGALISFEDGKPYKLLKRHLSTLGLTPDEYRAKWGLPPDYPMVAPTYSATRSARAKEIGLGTATRTRRNPKPNAVTAEPAE